MKLEVQIERNDDEGLTISIRASINFDFLKRKDNRTFYLGGIECFLPKSERLSGVNGYFVCEEKIYECKDYPNLCMLLARDLKDGVVFRFGKWPITDQQIENWAIRFEEQIACINKNYLGEKKIGLNFDSGDEQF